jgi:hypothetical protein
MPRLTTRKRPPQKVRCLRPMLVTGEHREPGYEFTLPAAEADNLLAAGRVQLAADPPPPWLDAMRSRSHEPVKLRTIRAFVGAGGFVHLPGDELAADGITARNLVAGRICERA